MAFKLLLFNEVGDRLADKAYDDMFCASYSAALPGAKKVNIPDCQFDALFGRDKSLNHRMSQIKAIGGPARKRRLSKAEFVKGHSYSHDVLPVLGAMREGPAMLPLPEAIRLSLSEATRRNDADLLRRAHADILVSLAGAPQERVGRDVLVLCAETAVKVRILVFTFSLLPPCVHSLGMLVSAVRSTHIFPRLPQLRAKSIATNALELYFLESGEGDSLELKDQFVCRAWYAKALLHAIGCEGQTGRPLVVGTLDALGFLLKGLKLALSDRRYLFLVFDASVHYSVISRPLQKTGTRKQLVESSFLIAQGLESVTGHEAWRSHFMRLHALCLSDADKNDEALQVASKAYELCKDAIPALSTTIVKLKSHIGALSGKKEGGDGADGAAALVQFVRSGACKDVAEVESTLKEAWGQVDPAASSEGDAMNQSMEGADMDSVAYIGWIAAQHQLRDLADWCVRRSGASESTLARARGALTSHLLALDKLGDKKGTLNPSAIEVHKSVVNRTDEELSSFLRLQDSSGVQDACQLIWKASLPLLQPDLRHNLTRVFASATNALESMNSTLNRLRAALHLELAHCYVAEDNLKEAHAHVSKGLTLDYTATETEVERTGYERPLDRYLVPLEHMLKIKGGFHDDKEGVEDQVLLLTEQARDAKSARNGANLLHDAFDRLSSLDKLLPYPVKEETTTEVDAQEGDAPENETNSVHTNTPADNVDPETVRRKATARMNLWANMCETAADAKLFSLAHKCVANVFGIAGWDPAHDKEAVVQQIETNFVDSVTCVALLKGKGEPVVPPAEVNVDSIGGDSDTDLQNGASAAFLRAARLGMSVNESWAVMNAATYAWNTYIDLIKNHRYAEMLAVSAPLLEELNKLDDCDPVLLGNYAHLVASGYEHEAYLSANSALMESTETPSEVDGEEPETSVEPDETEEIAVTDYDVLCAQFASRALEDSEKMKQAIATCESALPRVDETSTRRISAMLGRLQVSSGNTADVTVEDDVVAQVAALIPRITKGDPKDGGEILTRAIGLLRPEGAGVVGDVEIWARLGQAGLAIQSFGSAIECCEQASVLSKAPDYSASRQSWYWSGVAACAYGSSIVGLLRPARQDESAQNALKQKAFEQFVEAANYGRRAQRSDIVCHAAKCFWNAGTSFMASASARKVLVEPLELILDAARATKVSDYKFLQSAYVLLFDCLMDVSAWEQGAKQVDAAFKALPSNEHKPLWEYKVMFLSSVGKSVDEDIDIISEYEEEMQAKIWAVLAAQATVPFDAIRAHRKAIHVLKGKPTVQVEYMADFAEWLHTSSGQPVSDAEDILLSAVDVLLAIDPSQSDDVAPIETTFGTKQMCSAIRVFLMLSKISGNNDTRTDHLLMAQQYASRLLRESMTEATGGAPLPETAEDWAHLTFSEEMYASVRKNAGEFEITIDSLGRPEMLHTYIEYLCGELEIRSMHVQCLPLWQLGMLIAKLAAKDDALVAVYHLKLAATCDALLLRSACSLHETLAGPLDLSAEEEKQGRLEVKRADALKTGGDTPEEVSTSKSLRPLALRDYWLARGAYLVRRGALSAAAALLQETVVHAHAHGDTEIEAWAYLYLAKCASHGNKPVDAIRFQLRGQTCAGDVAFWGENLSDFSKDKLATRDGQLSAKDSLLTALKLLRNRLVFAGRGDSLDTKMVLADLHVELSNVLQVEMRQVLLLGDKKPDALFEGAVRAVSEAITILRSCGGSMLLVKALLSLSALMYKDPSATGDPRPALKTIRNVINEAELQAETILAAACEDSLNPLRSSLPAARLLAAVKNAKAGCLLELANAERTLAMYDLQQNRPEFPTMHGADATAVLEFLDDSVPETFDAALGAAEQAVVAASEAVNLHAKSDGSVDSLYLLGDALLAVHGTQIKAEAWTEPPPPPTLPASVKDGDDGEGEAVDAGGAVEDAADGEDKNSQPDDAENMSEDSRVTETDNAEETADVAHPELAPDLTMTRAIRALEQSIEVGLKTAKYGSVSKAAMCLAHAYGSADPGNAAAALALSQSCKVAESQLGIFTSAADGQDIEALLIRNKRLMEETLGDPASSKYSAALLNRLDSSSQAWRTLQINPSQCLATPPSLPEDLSVFSLQWITGRGGDDFLAIASHTADDTRVGAHVARADATQLSAAVSLVQNFRLSVEKQATNAPAPDGFSIKAGWGEVCKALEFVISPVLSAWKSFLGSEGAKGKKIVLLVDECLSPLPLEGLDFLADAAAVSRDFSLHILLERLADSSVKGDVSPSGVTYLVDLRNEDEGDDVKISTKFASMKEQYGADWHGAQGTNDGVPGDGECQRVMSSARGALMYFGHGRFLSYIPPPAVACLDLTQCRIALLACATTNEAARATQTRLDMRKNEMEKRMEDPYETASLLSTRGVDTIVLPVMPCTATGNAKAFTAMLTANQDLDADAPPVDVASAVWKADAPKATSPAAETEAEAPEGEEVDAGDDSGKVAEEIPYRRYVVWGLPSIKIRA